MAERVTPEIASSGWVGSAKAWSGHVRGGGVWDRLRV